MTESKKVKEIVLTGGPCSGKTTSLAYLTEKVRSWGYRVFTAPETATLFIAGGISDISEIEKNDFSRYFKIEKLMLEHQIQQRNSILKRAALFPDEKRVIIYDRAEADVAAYLPREEFEKLIKNMSLGWREIRDSYDGVIHLVSAARGAEKFYTLENNAARRENAKEAGIADEKTQRAWMGHPHLKIIDNSTGFEEKLVRSLQAVAKILMVPVPLFIEKKFLLMSPDFSHPVLREAVEIQIEQVYLLANKSEEIRVRKRNQKGDWPMYYRTHRKNGLALGMRQETEETISKREYEDLLILKDPTRQILRKTRYCFIYNNQYFELDAIRTEKIGKDPFYILEIKLTEENDKVDIPSFLGKTREVTGNKRYTNAFLAQY